MLNWQPAYTIKAYPELQGYFSRGENHLLSYLHNWHSQLFKKGRNADWVFLTQQQIAQAIDYSISSIKRFIQQVNQKIEGAIEVRFRPIPVTKYFAYTVTEYRVNWQKVTSFLASENDRTSILGIAVMAESSHHHFELGVAQNELGVAQNELTYKNQFNDQVNYIKDPSLSPQNLLEEEGNPEQNALDNDPEERQKYMLLPFTQNTVNCAEIDLGGDKYSAPPPKNMPLTSQTAVALGLIQQRSADGTTSWVENPAGCSRGLSAWIQQGIALEFWGNKQEAIEFQGAVARYARDQSWCKSPLDYANAVIKGLLAGTNPKADRYWEAWHNHQPIGWENQFDWEASPGVVHSGFANWLATQLFDSTKSPAANTALVAKELKFNAKPLWERYQREVSREVENAIDHQRRGQAYLPPGALLPRTDQPTANQTEDQINLLTQAQVKALPVIQEQIEQLPAAEITAAEFAVQQPTKADILEKMRRIGSVQAKQFDVKPVPLALIAPEQPSVTRPLTIELLPLINQRRKQLELQWRRKTPPCDLTKLAKYQVWAEHGDQAMKQEAIEWLSVHLETCHARA